MAHELNELELTLDDEELDDVELELELELELIDELDELELLDAHEHTSPSYNSKSSTLVLWDGSPSPGSLNNDDAYKLILAGSNPVIPAPKAPSEATNIHESFGHDACKLS
jgi:hypothetical protein